MTEQDTAARIMALRKRAETAKDDVTRKAALVEQSEAELAKADAELRAAEIDPEGDVDAQLSEAKAGVETELAALEDGLRDLEGAASGAA